MHVLDLHMQELKGRPEDPFVAEMLSSTCSFL